MASVQENSETAILSVTACFRRENWSAAEWQPCSKQGRVTRRLFEDVTNQYGFVTSTPKKLEKVSSSLWTLFCLE
jgi:hypothetical protein